MQKETRGMTAGVAVFALTLPARRYAVMYLDPVFVGFGRKIPVSTLSSALLDNRSP